MGRLLVMVIRSMMKPRSFVLFAAGLASCVPLALGMLKWATGERADPNAPEPPGPDTWRRLYRQSRRVVDALWENFGLTPDSSVSKELTSRDARQELMPFPPTRDELLATFAWAGSRATPEGLRAMVLGDEGQFLIRVWLPCLVLYREPPGRLLRRARGGDDDAFEDLLRLDKSVISDRVLWRRWHAALNDAKPARRERFREAMAGHPRKRFDAKTIRIAFAGLLSQAAKREGCEMNAPEIREWFAAFAKNGYLGDDAMPGGEALAKGIQRNRDWPARKRAAEQDKK